jgi:PAS domain S-box-containing protein
MAMGLDHEDTLSPEQYRLILDSLSEGVCTVDREWTITSFNRQAQLLFGVSEAEAVGQPFAELFHCEVCECQTLLAGVMASGAPVRDVATRIKDRQERPVPVMMNAAPFRNGASGINGLVISFRDNRPLETLRRELRQSFTFRDMVSRNPRMNRMFDILPAVAESDSAVLILGASGTGKELLARAIHQASARSGQPFVAVNCGALPDTLLESELFGYKKGAFTDARVDKLGRFALAEGGTLFLDEIGDTTPAMQVKLLRVLQERVYEPLGATKSVAANVRVITATNRDLAAGVADGSFRADLYYRINVISFDLPSLAERPEDIPLLAAHFIETLNAEQGRTVRGVSRQAMERLMRYEYPGNIRELRNIIERAYVLCRCDEIQEQCLPPHLLDAACPSAAAGPVIAPDATYVNLRQLTPERERSVIEEALAAEGGSRKQAAARLGIDPATLWRKMKRHGLLGAGSRAG